MSIDPRLLHGGLDADVDIDSPTVDNESAFLPDLAPEPGPSKLTLKIPSLKALREAKKSGLRTGISSPMSSNKTPRPQKLKPLKDILMGLITKIKKCVYLVAFDLRMSGRNDNLLMHVCM